MRTPSILACAGVLALAFPLAETTSAQRRPQRRREPEPPVAEAPRSWATLQVGDVLGHAAALLADAERREQLEASDLPALANWLSHRPFTLDGWQRWLESGRAELPTGLCWHTDEATAIGLGLIGRNNDLRRRERALKQAHDVLEVAYRDGSKPFGTVLESLDEDATDPFENDERSPLPLGELTYGTSLLEYTERHLRRHRHADAVEPDLERPVTPDLPEGVLLRATGPGDPLGLRELLLPADTRCEGSWTLEVRTTDEGYRIVAVAHGGTVADELVGLDELRIGPAWRKLLAGIQRQLHPRPERDANAAPARIPASARTLTLLRDREVDKRDPGGLRFEFGEATFQDLDELFVALVRQAADPDWWLREDGADGFQTVDLRLVVRSPATYSDVASTVDVLVDAGIHEFHFVK